MGVYADLTVPFVCAATCTTATLRMTAGTAAGGTQIRDTLRHRRGGAVFGDADAELDTASCRCASTAVQDAYVASWSATQIITIRLTSGTGNDRHGQRDELQRGSVTFYLITEVFP